MRAGLVYISFFRAALFRWLGPGLHPGEDCMDGESCVMILEDNNFYDARITKYLKGADAQKKVI